MKDTQATMDKQRNFWNSRVKSHNHTGWADYLKYAFDQPARLKAIGEVLERAGACREKALDYGCGNGDFSRMLAGRFKDVVAYDISDEVIRIAKEKQGAEGNILFTADANSMDLAIPDSTLDLVLSVTVLGHILDDADMGEILSSFQRKLAPGGILIALEYSLPEKKEDCDYQRFSTFEEWKALFAGAGFSLERYYGFYHPVKRPVGSYLRYKFNPEKIFWSFFQSIPFARRRIGRIAENLVAKYHDFYWDGVRNDWMRIMVFRNQKP